MNPLIGINRGVLYSKRKKRGMKKTLIYINVSNAANVSVGFDDIYKSLSHTRHLKTRM